MRHTPRPPCFIIVVWPMSRFEWLLINAPSPPAPSSYRSRSFCLFVARRQLMPVAPLFLAARYFIELYGFRRESRASFLALWRRHRESVPERLSELATPCTEVLRLLVKETMRSSGLPALPPSALRDLSPTTSSAHETAAIYVAESGSGRSVRPYQRRIHRMSNSSSARIRRRLHGCVAIRDNAGANETFWSQSDNTR